MSNLISMDKKYRANDQIVRLFTTTASNRDYPVVGEVGINLFTWTAKGRNDSSRKSVWDLVEIEPVVIKPWRWYKDSAGQYYTTFSIIFYKSASVIKVDMGGNALETCKISQINFTDWIEIPNPFAEEK